MKVLAVLCAANDVINDFADDRRGDGECYVCGGGHDFSS